MIRKSHTSLIFRTTVLTALIVPALVAGQARADVVNQGGTVTVTPGGRVTQTGYRTAVISGTATDGNADTARNAMVAATVALNLVPGFSSVPAKDVAGAFGDVHLRDTLDVKDYQEIGKKLGVPRVLTVSVTPGDVSDSSAEYSAVVELFDTKTGGLVGRGQASSAITADAIKADSNSSAKSATNSGKMAEALPNRALSSAVYRACRELSRGATFSGTVISLPEAYRARLSLGERDGLRNGARVEYVNNGVAVAYGTVIDLGAGEAVATVAPEADVTAVTVNTNFRADMNPSADRAGKSAEEIVNSEFKSFETQFGVAAAIASIIYFVARP